NGRVGGGVVPWVLFLPKASEFSFVARAADLVSAPNRPFTRYPDDFRLKVLPDYLRASLTGRTLTDQDAFTRMPLPELWTGWGGSNALKTADCSRQRYLHSLSAKHACQCLQTASTSGLSLQSCVRLKSSPSITRTSIPDGR